MSIAEWKRKRSIRKQEKKAKRAAKKLTYWGMLWKRLLIVQLIIICIVVSNFIDLVKNYVSVNNGVAYARYVVRLKNAIEQKDLYSKGGTYYFEYPDCDLDSQWEQNSRYRESLLTLNIIASEADNAYWCLYDFTNGRIVKEPGPESYVAWIGYDNKGPNGIRINRKVRINPKQTELLQKIHASTRDTAFLSSMVYIDVTSAYIRNDDFIIRSYRMDDNEYNCNLDGMNTEGYQLMTFVENPDSSNPDGETNDSTEFKYPLIYYIGATSTGSEVAKKKAMDALRQYQNNPEKTMKQAKEQLDENTIVLSQNLKGAISGEYRILSVTETDGIQYGVVLVIDEGQDRKNAVKELLNNYCKTYLLLELWGITVAVLWTLVSYCKRRDNHELYSMSIVERIKTRKTRKRKATVYKLAKKPSYWSILWKRLVIAELVLLSTLAYIMNDVLDKQNEDVNIKLSPIFLRAVDVLDDMKQKEQYAKGGKYYLDFSDYDLDSQWETCSDYRSDWSSLMEAVSQYDNAYCCLYDFTNGKIVEEPKTEPESFVVRLVYYDRGGVAPVGKRDIHVNPGQYDLLYDLYEQNYWNIYVGSMYVRNDDCIIRSYYRHYDTKMELHLDVSGMNTEGYQFLTFEHSNPDAPYNLYSSDGKMDISLSRVYLDGETSTIVESAKNKAMKVIRKCQDNPEKMKGATFYGEENNNAIMIFYPGFKGLFSNKYRILVTTEIDGIQYGVVSVFDLPKEKNYLPICLAIVFGVAAVVAIWSSITYFKRKTDHEAYAYRTSLTAAMATALKEPLRNMGTVVDAMSKDSGNDTEYTAEIESQITYMNGLISNLLQLGRNEGLRIRETSEILFSEIAAEQFQTTEFGDENMPIVSGDAKLKVNRKMFGDAVRLFVQGLCEYTKEPVTVTVSRKKISFLAQLSGETEVTEAELLTPFNGDNAKRKYQHELDIPVAKSICEAHGFRVTVSVTKEQLLITVIV